MSGLNQIRLNDLRAEFQGEATSRVQAVAMAVLVALAMIGGVLLHVLR